MGIGEYAFRRSDGAPVSEARSAVTRIRVVGLLSLLACSSAPQPTIAGAIPLDVRVRVMAPKRPPGWHPARLIESDQRCRVVTVATARQPDPLLLLNMGQITRLQISQAPPRDWWTEPEESEGWNEIELIRLRDEADRCRQQYPPDVRR